MRSLFSFLVLFVVLPLSLLAEPKEFCGFKTTKQHVALEYNRQSELADISDQTFQPGYLPVVFHIVRTSYGGGGLPPNYLPKLIDDLNYYFKDEGFEFYFQEPVLFIDSDYLHDDVDSAKLVDELMRVGYVPQVVNIYIGQNSPYGGWGEFTSMHERPSIFIDTSCIAFTSEINKYINHEMGHYLNLYHTFDEEFGVECPDGSNCETAGDLICDTPADPNISRLYLNYNCELLRDFYPPSGCVRIPYDPPVSNMMSYYPSHCMNMFTPEQYDRMRSLYDLYDRGVKRYLMYNIDTTNGWAPFAVNVDGYSKIDILNWSWNFGDSETGSGVSSQHIYEEAGVYSVTVTGETESGSYSNNTLEYIYVFGDTARIENKEIYPGVNSFIEVYANNTLPLKAINLSFKFDNLGYVTFDSVSTIGCRTELSAKPRMTLFRPFTKEYAYYLEATDGYSHAVDSGAGGLLRIYFTAHESTPIGTVLSLTLGGIDGYVPEYIAEEYTVNPVVNAADIEVIYTCCKNKRGNVDFDPDDICDISDLVYFVQYSFGSEPPVEAPACFDEADVDANSILDIEDVVFLVDYMFRNGDAPTDCH